MDVFEEIKNDFYQSKKSTDLDSSVFWLTSGYFMLGYLG